MSLSPGLTPLLLALLAMACYGVATLPVQATNARLPAVALVAGWVLHLVVLMLDIGGWGQSQPGARLGFAPVLSITVWLVMAVHTIEGRFVPLPTVRLLLAPAGALAVLVGVLWPGEPRVYASALAPLHFALGVGSYGLLGAAVLHATMLDAAERRMRLRKSGSGLVQGALGMPLLQLERLTFRFVEAGFVVLTVTLLLGVMTTAQWRWDHKTVFSLLGWAVFAGLLSGRRLHGWRGKKATRWLYAGAALLLLAYVGSRFVMEVMLARPAA
jgi:ABC-type uncharacterized transport system permease subunit